MMYRLISIILIVAAVLIVLFSAKLLSDPNLDSFNLLPAIASLYLGLAVALPEKVLGSIGSSIRSNSRDDQAKRRVVLRYLSTVTRAILVVGLLWLAAEFSLRMWGHHRRVQYQRQGNLLFTPVPNQDYIEKISLTPSQINNLGLRGPDVADSDLEREVVLCLGDSITYGYGVEENQTYPSRLGQILEESSPGEFTVLNGGVNAYPMSFIHQKFLYLWETGVRPSLVVVSYSMNEGWLGHMVASDAREKDHFERRVHWKNMMRSLASYNLIVEKVGRVVYDKMKQRLVPGTHFTNLTEEEVGAQYQRVLAEMVEDMQARGVHVILLLPATWNKDTERYDSGGFLKDRFVKEANMSGIPLLRAEELLTEGTKSAVIEKSLFLDGSHMSADGCNRVAEGLARTIRNTQPGESNY